VKRKMADSSSLKKVKHIPNQGNTGSSEFKLTLPT
jgi:hypothetical protein